MVDLLQPQHDRTNRVTPSPSASRMCIRRRRNNKRHARARWPLSVPQQLACLPANGTAPAVNQLPYSVGHGADTSVADNAKAGGITVQAYSPLGSGGVLSDPDCVSIGKAHNKSSAQVALRWILQRNATFTTSSSSLAHFQDDLAVFDFKLSAQEMATLNAKSLNL